MCGISGVHKTYLVTYLLLEPAAGVLDSDYDISLWMVKKSDKQIFDLQNHIGDVNELIGTYKGKCRGGINARFINDPLDIPDPSEYDPEQNDLVLDDVMVEPKSKLEAYYLREGWATTQGIQFS